MTDATRTPQDAAGLSLADAAAQLGISPDAARKRLERGTLRGEKHDGRWTVFLEPDAAASADQDDHWTLDAAQDAGAVQVLRELLAEERRKSDALLEAATVWQARAAQLEERLKQIEAGPITSNVPQERDSGSLRADVVTDPSQGRQPTSPLQESGLRRWWRRVTGV